MRKVLVPGDIVMFAFMAVYHLLNNWNVGILL